MSVFNLTHCNQTKPEYKIMSRVTTRYLKTIEEGYRLECGIQLRVSLVPNRPLYLQYNCSEYYTFLNHF